jgi:glycosidase
LFILFLPIGVLAETAGIIDRVEPPNWWTGFRETELQLMVHGENISGFEPSVSYPGLSIQRVEQVDSPNYLFVYLNIAADTQPGTFDITFRKEDRAVTVPYELRLKNTDREYASGFDSSDAIYLITPDRFVNGDPDNDTVSGMGDPADRNKPGGRHGGDIRGIRDHLDYIRDMGFTAIWLNPVLENRMPEYSYHGYSTTDFYRVDPRFGSNEEYRELVAAARELDIRIIMDMIVNHIGSEHWWMDDLPTDDWLNHSEDYFITSHEHMTEQDPHVSAWDSSRFSDGWFVSTMPDLNQRNPLLADYLVQNALWWIEYLGLGGIRMDTYPYSDKHFMTDWARRIMREYPQFNIVGEEMVDNPAMVAYWQRGWENRDGYISDLPTLMDFPLQNALRWGLMTAEGSKLEDLRPGGLLYLYRALANDFLYPDPDALVIFPDNHDLSRVYSQLGENQDLYRMALAFVLTMRGVPQIYYGTEILMTNPGTEDHGVIRSDFPGGWADDSRSAFTGEGLTEPEQKAQAFLRTLLQWRKGKPVIHSGKTMHFRPENGVYVYFRYDDSDTVMVVINKNEEQTELGLERFAERIDGITRARDVLNGQDFELSGKMVLPARSVQVLDLR